MTRRPLLLAVLISLAVVSFIPPALSATPRGTGDIPVIFPEPPNPPGGEERSFTRLDLFVLGLPMPAAQSVLEPRQAFPVGTSSIPELYPEPALPPGDSGPFVALPMLTRVSPDGAVVWQQELPYPGLVSTDISADRNVREDAFYLAVLGETNRVNGLYRLAKYDASGRFAWELFLGPSLRSVSANPIFGGAYVADDELGVFRVDGGGHVVWGPLDLGPTHPGNALHDREVSTDLRTGGVYVTFNQTGASSVVMRFGPNGHKLWERSIAFASRPIANPLDGGVYVAASETGLVRANTARYAPDGTLLWMREHFPGSQAATRALATNEGFLIASGSGEIGCLASDGTEHWCVPNDDGAGHVVGTLGLAGDPGADLYYTAEDQLDHGISKFDGNTHARLWHLDPTVDARNFLLYMGVPAGQNQMPDFAAASARVAYTWPPSHLFLTVSIQGVTDPDGDDVSIAVTNVTQDEVVYGAEHTCPDALIVNGVAKVRIERDSHGNGRIYELTFTATDTKGASREGKVTLCVPGGAWLGTMCCTDDGQRYNSLALCAGVNNDENAAVRLGAPIRIGGGVQIEYALENAGDVEISVFDVAGRRLATPVNEFRGAGTHTLQWNAAGMRSGLYFCRIRSGGEVVTRQLVIAP